MILIFLLLAAIVVGISFSLNWRFTVKSVFFIAIFEGVLRKWVLPQASDLIYFFKDLVLIGAYLKFYLSSEPKYPFKINNLTLMLFSALGWCSFQVFNPSLNSTFAGLFGLKAYFLYIPLVWILPSLFKSEEELYTFLRNYLLLVIPVALLGVAQFFSPASSPINFNAGGQETNAVFHELGAVRVTGTFSYLLGYSTYLSACFSLLITLLTVQNPGIWRWLTIFELFLVIGTSFMTGSRGLLLFEVLFFLGYSFLVIISQPALANRATKQLIVPAMIGTIFLPKLFAKGINAFTYRTATSSSENFLGDRVFGAFLEPFQAVQYKGFDGYGIGSTHQGLLGLIRLFHLPIRELPPAWEGEMGRIVLEIGLLGFLLWYGLRLVLMISLWQVFWKLREPFLRQLALAAFLFHALGMTSQLVFNHTFAVYYWFFSSFIFLLPYLETREFFSRSNQIQEQNV